MEQSIYQDDMGIIICHIKYISSQYVPNNTDSYKEKRENQEQIKIHNCNKGSLIYLSN